MPGNRCREAQKDKNTLHKSRQKINPEMCMLQIVTAIPSHHYSMDKHGALHLSRISLYGLYRQLLDVTGYFKEKLDRTFMLGPFGISSASENFQGCKKMICHANDILMNGKDLN